MSNIEFQRIAEERRMSQENAEKYGRIYSAVEELSKDPEYVWPEGGITIKALNKKLNPGNDSDLFFRLRMDLIDLCCMGILDLTGGLIKFPQTQSDSQKVVA
jgi:hypothetical protein